MADLVNNNALTEASQQLQAQLLLQQQQQQQQQQPLSWYSSFLSFTQGFLLGQASVVLLVFVFLKYFIFGDSESVRRGRRKGKDERRIRGQKQGRSKGYRERDRRKGRNVSAGTASSDESSSSSSSDEGCSRSDKQEQSSSIAAAANAAASVLRSNRPLSASTLLDKTYYHTRHDLHNSAVETDHRTEYAEQQQKHHNQQGRRKHYQYHNKHNKNHTHHDPESLDWFNVLVAQAIAQLRADAFSNNVLLVRSLTEALNGNAKSDWMDEIRVTEISLGEEFPIFKNCRIVSGRPAGSEKYGDGDFGYEETLGGEGEGEEGLRKQRRIKRKKAKKVLQAHMDVELRDAITLGLETKLVLNYPRPLAAMLPVGLVVEVVRFEGTLSISFDSSSPDDTSSSSYSVSGADLTASTSNKKPAINRSNHNQYEANPYNNRNTTTTTSTSKRSTTHPSSISALSSPSLHLNLTFLPDYTLDLAIRSQLGSRSRIQDIPKIAQLVEQRLLAWFEERFVAPRGGWRVGVPRLFDGLRMESGLNEG